MSEPIDLSDAALERLLALDGQRTPGEWRPFRNEYAHGWYADGIATGSVVVIAANGAACAKKATNEDKEAIAAAVNHLTPLVAEVQRLRKELERAYGPCDEPGPY